MFTEEYIISFRKMTTLIHTLKMEMILVQTVMTTWMKQPISYEISPKMSLWCHFWTFGQTCFLFLIRNIVFLFLFCWTNTCCQNIQNHFEFTYYLPYQSVSDTLTFLFNTPVIRLLYSSGFFLYRLDFNVPRVFAFFNLCIHTWTNYSCWTRSVVKLLLVIIVDFCNLKVDTIILHKEHFKNKETWK